MLLTPRRGYPYPASEREAGNGGLASELLARAVAKDLDALDAAWAGETTKSTKALTLATDVTGIVANQLPQVIGFSAIEKVSGLAFTTSTNRIEVMPGFEGWYFATCQMRAVPVGAVTLGSQYRITLSIQRTGSTGVIDTLENRAADTYSNSATTTTMFNSIQGMFEMFAGDRLVPLFNHTNTGSNVKVDGTATGPGTRLQVTRVCGF